jgi:hypothetical protein
MASDIGITHSVEDAFGGKADFAQLHKIYRASGDPDTRNSPATCIGCEMKRNKRSGRDPKHVSASFLERQNWTVRTTMRRYSRSSNGFSRKMENHAAATALKLFCLQFHQDSSYTSHVPSDGR